MSPFESPSTPDAVVRRIAAFIAEELNLYGRRTSVCRRLAIPYSKLKRYETPGASCGVEETFQIIAALGYSPLTVVGAAYRAPSLTLMRALARVSHVRHGLCLKNDGLDEDGRDADPARDEPIDDRVERASRAVSNLTLLLSDRLGARGAKSDLSQRLGFDYKALGRFQGGARGGRGHRSLRKCLQILEALKIDPLTALASAYHASCPELVIALADGDAELVVPAVVEQLIQRTMTLSGRNAA